MTKLWPVQFVSNTAAPPSQASVYTAKSRGFNSDRFMSLHHEALIPHSHTRASQDILFIDT